MYKRLRWHDHIFINIYWLGINIASGSITPVILPSLVALFVAPALKNTYLGNLRVISLAVAMMIQPIAGTMSDGCTSRWGRRRPFIAIGTLFNLLFLAIVALSPRCATSALGALIQDALGVNAGYVFLLLGIVLLQVSSNFTQGALQGLIPDLVPEDQRGRASGVKAVMELLPVFLVILIGPLVDRGRLDWAIGIVAAGFLITMLITVLGVREKPLLQRPPGPWRSRILRAIALAIIFVAVSQSALALVRWSANSLSLRGANVALQVSLLGATGLLAMAGSIFLGVYVGAWVGIGARARQEKSFIWWVINRLLFLAAVGSIQGFALFYLRDVIGIENPATWTSILLAAVAVFLLPSALIGGYIADGKIPRPTGPGLKALPGRLAAGTLQRTGLHRLGRKGLVGLAGVIATLGAGLLLLAQGIPLVLLSGCILGLGTGLFYATSWALGTDLAPQEEAGRYLGISNLAGAGAGIVGAGIGGPMADFFNLLQPGLGYLVIFGIYAGLFALSTLSLRNV